jgi:hypothetical protein
LSGASPSQLASTFRSGFFKPWFRTEGNLPLCSSYLPLGVPKWVAKHRQSSIFLAPLPGRRKISARGVSRFQSFSLLLFCLFFFTLFLLAYFYQKYKKKSSFIVIIFACLLLVLLE